MGKKKEICCLLKVQINLEVRWIEYNFQQILCIVNVEISKEVYYSSSYSKASVIFFFEVRYCHWAKRIGKDKNCKQLVGFCVPEVKRCLTNYLTINLEDKCHR